MKSTNNFEKEQYKYINYLLRGVGGVLLLYFMMNWYYQRYFLMVTDTVFFIFFTFIYFYIKKTSKIRIASHISLAMIIFLLTLISFRTHNIYAATMWFFIVPLLSFWLLSLKEATLYSSLSLAIILLVSLYEGSDSSFTTVQTILVFIVTTLNLYYLSKSRQKAFVQLAYNVSHLEERVQEAIEKEKKHQRALIQSSKMASLGELLSSIAHQWKQPISAIAAIGATLRLQEELNPSSEPICSELIDDLDSQTQFMQQTMNDFRSFFKSNEKKRAFDLAQATHELVNLFQKNFLAQNIKIHLLSAGQEIQVVGFENMFKQALLNIITNAKDAIEEHNPAVRSIDISYALDDSYGSITIADYAGGIPKEMLQKVFENHFTTKGDKGTGVGLALSKELIEDLAGGRLTVENIDGGASFTISLPIKK